MNIFTLDYKVVLLTVIMSLAGFNIRGEILPKREFRGAWIQCVNGQFLGMSPTEMKRSLTEQLNELQACGINAIMFQVRAEADALYASKFEPWSRFLTGNQGVAPVPYWDPLEWMIEACHARGMELHAWINPYRAKTKGTKQLANTHPAICHPERFFSYGNQIIMDPGLPENREYLCIVVTDILMRYDVDGIHIDDYFYPYPESGLRIADETTYAQYGGNKNLGDWRRENVNKLIEMLHDCIREIKPWVKFGVSPFGIYRNSSTDPNGSATRGLQNYDDLYADVLQWIEKRWVDYNIPQIYWEIGHLAADYETLIRWWSNHAGDRLLFIGQDVERTTKAADPNYANQNQLRHKMSLQRSLPNVEGSCWWYAKAVCNNVGGCGTELKHRYYRKPALLPKMPWIDDKSPKRVRNLTTLWTDDGLVLFWRSPKGKGEMNVAREYVVYRFNEKERVDISFSENIIAITRNTFIKLPYKDGSRKYTYVVTALDRLHNESRAVKKKVKL